MIKIMLNGKEIGILESFEPNYKECEKIKELSLIDGYFFVDGKKTFECSIKETEYSGSNNNDK